MKYSAKYGEIVMDLANHRKTKPKSIVKRFGKMGPTEEQLKQYQYELKEYNREYRRLKNLLLKEIEKGGYA